MYKWPYFKEEIKMHAAVSKFQQVCANTIIIKFIYFLQMTAVETPTVKLGYSKLILFLLSRKRTQQAN